MLLYNKDYLRNSPHRYIRSAFFSLEGIFQALSQAQIEKFIGVSEEFYDRFVLEGYKLATFIRFFHSKGTSAADIGSGIGFPGPFVGFFSNLAITCFENNPLKAKFIQETYNNLFSVVKKTATSSDVKDFDVIMGRASLKTAEVISFSRSSSSFWLIGPTQLKDICATRATTTHSSEGKIIFSYNVPRGTFKNSQKNLF